MSVSEGMDEMRTLRGANARSTVRCTRLCTRKEPRMNATQNTDCKVGSTVTVHKKGGESNTDRNCLPCH